MRKTPPPVDGPCIMFRVMLDNPLLKANNNNKQTNKQKEEEREKKK